MHELNLHVARIPPEHPLEVRVRHRPPGAPEPLLLRSRDPFWRSAARSPGGRECPLDGHVVICSESISFGPCLIWLRGGLGSLERSLSVGSQHPSPKSRVETQLESSTGLMFPVHLSPLAGAAVCPAVHGPMRAPEPPYTRAEHTSDRGAAKPQRRSEARCAGDSPGFAPTMVLARATRNGSQRYRVHRRTEGVSHGHGPAPSVRRQVLRDYCLAGNTNPIPNRFEVRAWSMTHTAPIAERRKAPPLTVHVLHRADRLVAGQEDIRRNQRQSVKQDGAVL